MSERPPESSSAERHARVKEIFLDAVDRAGEERTAFLDRACGGDAELRREVDSLLQHHVDAPLIADAVHIEEPVLEATAPSGAAPPASSGSTVPQRPGSVWPDDPPRLVDIRVRDPLQLAGITLDDRYKVQKFIAEGGFGYVYRAEHLRWRRPVAIKVFKTVGSPQIQDALREAFVKEGALLNELSRKTTAIAQSYDVGTWTRPSGPPLVFTVLEWLEGRSLYDVLGKPPRQPWSIEQVIETIAPVADALAIAHASGVAHRDVKPRNVFLVEEQGSRAVKLLDFGAAKVAADLPDGFASTGAGLTVLTASYAAPEQYDKKYGATGPWTDVYALALMCVELMLGKHPHEVGIPFGAAAAPTPRRAGLAVSDRVEEVFVKALAAEPNARYPDAAAFWNALLDAVHAPPPEPARVSWLWVAVAVALGVIGALIVLALIGLR